MADLPRLMIAAANSGAGKTTVTCAVLQAFVNRGLKMASFKCGPDYIDPMFHSEVIGAKSRNLDLFLLGEATVRELLCKNAADCDLSVLEGVMGFYDGVGGTTTQAGSYHLARATHTPVVLVVNVRGMSLSAAAIVKGFVCLRPDSGIQAVLLNRCSSASYPMIKEAIEAETSVPVVGYLPVMNDCSLESRHLGLVTADEVQNLKAKLSALAAQVEQTVDLDFLLSLAHSASDLPCPAPALEPRPLAEVRIAVARDKAFCFYYEDSLDLLREMGACLIPFSPLEDEHLPEGISGLLLGGGYPEVYAAKLSANESMRGEVRRALIQGMPCAAECGGFMYLHTALEGTDGVSYPMAGAVEGSCFNTGKLCRFGYATLTAAHDNLLCEAGEQIPAHEFHYWDSTVPGSGFAAVKPVSQKHWSCGHTAANLYAGFAHFHFYSNRNMARRFLWQCEIYKKQVKNNDAR